MANILTLREGDFLALYKKVGDSEQQLGIVSGETLSNFLAEVISGDTENCTYLWGDLEAVGENYIVEDTTLSTVTNKDLLIYVHNDNIDNYQALEDIEASVPS
jgi:hypothetical protein